LAAREVVCLDEVKIDIYCRASALSKDVPPSDSLIVDEEVTVILRDKKVEEGRDSSKAPAKISTGEEGKSSGTERSSWLKKIPEVVARSVDPFTRVFGTAKKEGTPSSEELHPSRSGETQNPSDLKPAPQIASSSRPSLLQTPLPSGNAPREITLVLRETLRNPQWVSTARNLFEAGEKSVLRFPTHLASILGGYQFDPQSVNLVARQSPWVQFFGDNVNPVRFEISYQLQRGELLARVERELSKTSLFPPSLEGVEWTDFLLWMKRVEQKRCEDSEAGTVVEREECPVRDYILEGAIRYSLA